MNKLNHLSSTPYHLSESELLYCVDLTDSGRHLAVITLWIFAPADQSVELIFPVWTPGSYMVREYTRNIEQMIAVRHPSTDNPNQPTVESLTPQRIGKNRWLFAGHPKRSWLQVRYRLYCRENSVRTNWLEDDYGFLTGAATFPWVEGRQQHSILVQLTLPQHWSHAVCALHHATVDRLPLKMDLTGLVGDETGIGVGATDAVRKQPCFVADHYDHLVDSPFLLGNLEQRRFDVSNRAHYLVNWGSGDLWDLDRATEDVRSIVAYQHRFWGDIPYDRYWFLNLCTEAGGGLEHDNCCVLMCSRWAMRRRETYLNWLALVSHEFFHTWNVRRLRPRTLQRYDYQSEQFLEELWIAEGITSYFDDLILVRCGVCSIDEYLGRLTANIQSVQSAPGRLVQDLASASWDAWTKHYRPDENSHNSRISYYLKGCLLAWVLDARLRQASDDRVSLEIIMRQLWVRYRQSGYTLTDFEDAVQDHSHAELRKWLDRQVREAGELDLQPALKQFGLRFQQLPESESALKSVSKAWIGSESTPTEGKLYVRRVFRGSPSDRAGLNVDDELISFDGYRVTPDTWPSRLEVYQPGDQIELLVSRRGKIRPLTIELGQRPEHNWQLEADPQADANCLVSWLS